MSRFSELSGCRDIFHFMTTRHGGVSVGPFASMNPGLYSADNPAAVQKNLGILADAIGLPVENIFMPHQTHQDKIFEIDQSFLELDVASQKQQLEGVDALVTKLPNVCVSISTADCVPVLLYAPDQKVVAAIHAGWRGTVLRIVQQTAEMMVRTYGCDPTQIIAGIGPSISQKAFEVGEEVVEAFANARFAMDQILWRNPETGKGHIDLWETNRLQLIEAGLCSEHIEILGVCTYANYQDYFSARRLGVRSGRIVSGIFMNK